ncbi:MAG: YIP1 family protein [Clostridia bacterium]|nr:YIP1 family protein [Clostridia bacterium]
MKLRKISIAVVTVILLSVMLAALPVSAGRTYQTYTYSLDGQPLYSPDAYTPIMEIDSSYMGLSKNLDNPSDIFVDKKDNVYISDKGNNRIVVLDRYFKLKFEISEFINDQGIPDKLNSPSGVYVTSEIIYVADTNQNRIVTFDLEGKFIKVIPQPEDALFDTGSVYKPVALVVDDYNRLYVVSSTTYQGVIVLNEDGTFISFIGAQKVAISAWAKLWRKIMTADQRAQTVQNISSEVHNIDLNDKGFMYVPTSSISDSKVGSAIKGKTKSGDYLPVKLLNKSGNEVMARNGFWPPAGEVAFSGSKSDGSINGVSKIIDVAAGPEYTWSIIDTRRQKIFTYDEQGNLLFAFGDSGSQLGNLVSIQSIEYMSDAKMLVLDMTNKNLTVYERTEYGDIIINALANQNTRQYDRAIDDWTEILKRNSNFDVAYIGIADALYRNGEYKEAMAYYESAYSTSGWSDSYKEIRKDWISRNVLLIPLIVIVIIVAVVMFFKFAGKVNKRAETNGKKKTFGEELLFVFHLMFHPFDGFWDLKHEKRGSVRASLVFIAVTIFAVFYQDIGSGYLVNPEKHYAGIINDALGVIVPFLLFIVGNWCLTTLFEGEGSFKDVFIATSYSLVPIPLLMIPTTIYSNMAISTEIQIVDFINTIAMIWAFLLIFLGMMVTHDYTISKNIITTLGTIVAMAFIMFVAILFTTLVGRMVSFVTNIIVEINYRL